MSELRRIILVDDHDIFRDGLKALITQKLIGEVIAEASNGKIFLDILPGLNPDLVIMDIAMPVMDGIEATQRALELYPEMKILVLSMFGDEEYYYKMIQAGAKGFILKSSGKNEFEQAIAQVAQGESYFSNELLRQLIVKIGHNKPETRKKIADKYIITDRETDVLKLMCSGLSSAEIGERLHLSHKTIESHKASLMSKTGTRNSIALLIYALKNKIIEI